MGSPVYRLENFEGPLDLILKLLRKNKIEIENIQIAELLEQYLDWMQTQEELNIEIASEFVAMASYLVYIKTRVVLSYKDEADDEMQELMKALEQRKQSELYSRIQEILPVIEEQSHKGEDILTRGSVALVLPDTRNIEYLHNKKDLSRVMKSILLSANSNKILHTEQIFSGIVGRERYPVSKKMTELLELIESGVNKFRNLFTNVRNRSELVASFLAILELCKNNLIAVSNVENDDYIIIKQQ